MIVKIVRKDGGIVILDDVKWIEQTPIGGFELERFDNPTVVITDDVTDEIIIKM